MADEHISGSKRIKLELDDLVDICDVSNGPTDPSPEDGNGSLMLDFPGPCEFGYIFRSDLVSNNSWLYSHILGQAFIRVGNVLHVHFSINLAKAPTSDLYIRAMPVFCSADHMHLPVNRCPLHSLEDDPRSEAHCDGTCRCDDFRLVGHVVRSTSATAIYCYDQMSGRHSVLVSVKNQMYDQFFTFSCKSSCSRGMERRPIRVVFTLEDENCLVLGRCSLNVKICSCPKRDMDRAEKEYRLTDGGTVLKRRPSSRPNDESRLTPVHSQVAALQDIADPISAHLNIIENCALNGNGDERMSKLKNDVETALTLIKKLTQVCSTIENTLDSLDSDI